MKAASASALSLLLFSALAACGSHDSGDASGTDGATSDVVGVTDLSELEAALGLEKDVKVGGQWKRGDDRLHAGACWQERFADPGQDPGQWEFRRYTSGAAFFRKLGVTAEDGDERAVHCVDYDVDDLSGGLETRSLQGMSLDVAIRSKLGKPGPLEGAMGSEYLDFERDALQIQDAEHFCGLYGLDDTDAPQSAIDPALEAGRAAQAACAEPDSQACQDNVYNVCKWVFVANTQNEGTVDFPAFANGWRLLGSAKGDVSASVEAFVYRYALKNNKDALRFSMAADPVGAFVSHRVSATEDVTVYEKLEVHHVVTPGATESLFLTVRNESDAPAHAVASCTRAVDATGAPTITYVCTGL